MFFFRIIVESFVETNIGVWLFIISALFSYINLCVWWRDGWVRDFAGNFPELAGFDALPAV